MKLAAAAGAVLLGASALAFLGGPEPLQAPDIPAFPEAIGHGAEALVPCRERPIALHFVTVAGADGGVASAGTYRAAVEALSNSHFNFIIFQTGGRIRMQGPQPPPVENMSCVYVAGQTAPGGGIAFGGGFSQAWTTSTDHIVYRYVTDRKTNRFGFAPFRGVLANCSRAWNGTAGTGGADAISIGPRADQDRLITVQNCLTFEPHANHPTHLNAQDCAFCTLYQNAHLQPSYRMPWAQNGPNGGVEIINNVVFNWRHDSRAIAGVMIQNLDIVNNWLQPGPASFGRPEGMSFREECFLGDGNCTASNYIDGNADSLSSYLPLPMDSAWRGSQRQYVYNTVDPGAFVPGQGLVDGDTVPLAYQRVTPLAAPMWPAEHEVMTPELRDEILADVGNSAGLTCDGFWFARRDSLDAAKIQEFYDGTGLSNAISFTFSGSGVSPSPDEDPVVPIPDSGTPCADTSGDGMPDEWLQRWGFSHTDPPPADSATVSGYWLIEHYLNGSNPFDPTPWLETPPTFNNRWFYLMGGAELIEVSAGGGTVLIPDTTVIPRGFARKLVYNHPNLPAADSALIMTCEAYGLPVDSASVDALVSIWSPPGIPDAAYLRNTIFPGSPC